MTIVVLPEGPPRHRPDAEEIEVVPRDNARRDALGLAASEQDEPHVVVLDDRLERLRLLAVVVDLEGENPCAWMPARGRCWRRITRSSPRVYGSGRRTTP